MTKKEFADGWAHFCSCIGFGSSNLDAEAIRFMNEMPAEVGKVFDVAEAETDTNPYLLTGTELERTEAAAKRK